ncbi:MAG: type II toxin-antitoxin system RelE/ParE family toxin [Gemmatimonadales bacterium]|nr:type II toxin-antitoxin system RelE/ParE family toxin [Gemmatimonadales bacterium]MDZ4388313.1 type II toxin-antitoxin system RelE/ParE family toxin [Gemmatimonadales bacterium]
MTQIKATKRFLDWLDRLKDIEGRARIQARIERLAGGNPGQHRRLKRGVLELKIDFGPGYRVYCTEREGAVIVLLCGGDKSSQTKDVQSAYELIESLGY